MLYCSQVVKILSEKNLKKMIYNSFQFIFLLQLINVKNSDTVSFENVSILFY